ncbi:uncharacterized protein [Nicotiana sylvestris]|uniref:Uncharacterized protein LOC104239535 isoform X2 n=1 Tax=Nicotiana sylvestris TaxID=4096 RepID=A0A1U7XKB0_NICSY|nr:PREDICTED: uncharacterized protein LOC104239535 isoform X2 [Nicotiana sylvestris]
MPFLEEWNTQPTVCYPEAVQDLSGWIRRLDASFPYLGRFWPDLAKTRWVAKNHGKILLTRYIMFLCFSPVSSILINFGHYVCVGLGDEVQMRPPLDGEMETSEPDKGKKRKKKAAVDSPATKKPKSCRPRASAKTSALASRASPSTGDEDDDEDEYRLAQRTRSGADVRQMSRLEEAKSGMIDSDRSRMVVTLEDGANVVPEPLIGCGVFPVGETVVAGSKSRPRAFRGKDLPLGDIDALGGLNLGPQFSFGELRDAQDPNTTNVGAPLNGGDELDNFLDDVDDVSEDINLNAPNAIEAAEKF